MELVSTVMSLQRYGSDPRFFEKTWDLNPIDLENWSYGWNLSFQRYDPDPRFFEKTWDLIVSRGPKPFNVLMTLKSSRSRDGQGLVVSRGPKSRD
jgi:hypothetical protein